MWELFVELLADFDVQFERGLTDSEVLHAETTFDFRFPPDVRGFLQVALPVSNGFPNWRSDSEESLRALIARPLDGILFDVKNNGFWLAEWGPKPTELSRAIAKARELFSAAPRLIPVFGCHAVRVMPDRPQLSGNPVFSIRQADMVVYGVNLRDWLIHEFLTREGLGASPTPDIAPQIEFWDVDRFFEARWSAGGGLAFDNRDGLLPK